MSLQGNIEEMGLGAVIQTLSINRYRGTLRIETEDGGSQFFFISEGEIVLVRQVKRDPVRLGDLLVKAGNITDTQLDEALEEQRKSRAENKPTARLGKMLVQMKMIEQDQIERAVRSKFEEDFLDLFLLDKGRFEFIFGLTPESLFGPEEKLERVTLDSSGIMLEAMRRIDEWDEIVKSLGSLDTIYRNRMQTMGPKITDYEFENISLPNETKVRLYESLDGTHSLREIIGLGLREGIATRLDTFLFLDQLKKHDLVKEMDFKTLLGEAKSTLGSGDVPGTAKYIRAILAKKEEMDIALIKRYLEFLKKYQRPRLAFDEARRFAANVLARGNAEQAIALYEMAVALDRNVEVIDRLFYALLRANKRGRAVEVGLMLREFLNSDAELSVAVRVAKNLKELDDRNPEVLELSGLILKRQERNEEAIIELDQALARIDHENPRRLTIIEALLELQPDRNELRDEQSSLELQHAQNQLRREIRRRWLFVLGSLILVVGVWRGYAEYRARVVMGTVEELAKKEPTDLHEVRRLGTKIDEVLSYGFTGVRGRAVELKEKNEETWGKLLKQKNAEKDDAVKAKTEEKHRKQEAEAKAKRKQELLSALSGYRAAVKAGKYKDASKRALAIAKEHGEEFPKETRELAVFVRVTSKPTGSAVYVGGKPIGKTPLAVKVRPRGKATVNLRLSGYRSQEFELSGAKYAEVSRTLVPGPTWKLELDEAPLPPRGWKGGVVVVTPAGVVRSVKAEDGSVRTEADVREAARGELSGLAVAGQHAVVTRENTVVGVDLRSGEVAWRETISEAKPFLEPVAAVLNKRPVALLASGDTLYVFDAATGEQALVPPATLEAEIRFPPTPGGRKTPLAFVVFGDRVAAVDLTKAGSDPGSVMWTKTGLTPTGTPIYSRSAEAVLVPTGSKFVSLDEAKGNAGGTLAPGYAVMGTALVRERLSVLGKNGFLSTLSAYNGEVLWQGRQVSKAVSAGPVALERDLVVADEAGKFLRFDKNGRSQKTPPISLGSPLTQPMLVHEGRIVAVTGQTVYCVELKVKR